MARKTIRNFQKARAFVRAQNICNTNEWFYFHEAFCPDDIPQDPSVAYKDSGWKGWRDFLCGPDCKSKQKHQFRYRWLPFTEARAFVHQLKLKSHPKWREYSKTDRPCYIPAAPEKVYKNCGWKDWNDWLGTKKKPVKYWRPFVEARQYARSSGLTGRNSWRNHYKKGLLPDDIPFSPHHAYKSEWKGWGDWFGNSPRRKWRNYERAKHFPVRLKINTVAQWTAYCKNYRIPRDIPKAPNVAYRNNGWTNWGDWLGTGRNKNFNWKSYEEAKNFASRLGLNSIEDWYNFCKSGDKPQDIPTTPWKVYRDSGWTGWRDWLGQNKSIQFPNNKCVPVNL